MPAFCLYDVPVKLFRLLFFFSPKSKDIRFVTNQNIYESCTVFDQKPAQSKLKNCHLCSSYMFRPLQGYLQGRIY
jgi:hypothetical protein